LPGGNWTEAAEMSRKLRWKLHWKIFRARVVLTVPVADPDLMLAALDVDADLES
jgi:hypothetical protein